MEKYFLFFVSLLIISCSRDKVVVFGKVTSNLHEKEMLYFDEMDIYSSKTIDSTYLRKKGKFSFSFTTKYPKLCLLKTANHSINLLLENGEKVKITGDWDKMDQIQIEGSKGSSLINDYSLKSRKSISSLDSIVIIYSAAKNNEIKNELFSAYDSIYKELKKYSIKFLVENYNSMAAILVLYQKIDKNTYLFNSAKDLQYFKIISDSLGKKYPKSKYVIALKKNTKSFLNSYYSQMMIKMAEKNDNTLPEIALPNIKDDTLKLSSLKGNFVVLNFWASWNDESVEKCLALKKIYDKYGSKGLKIYNVSFDNNITKWKNIIDGQQLKWINVNDPTFPNSKAALVYNVTTLPANYLISNDFATILGKNMSVYQLDELLNKYLK